MGIWGWALLPLMKAAPFKGAMSRERDLINHPSPWWDLARQPVPEPMWRTSLQNSRCSMKQHTRLDTAVFSELKAEKFFLLHNSHLQLEAVGLDDHCRPLPTETSYSISEKHSAQNLPCFLENPGRARCTATLRQPSLLHYNAYIEDYVLNNINVSEDTNPSNWGRNDSHSSLQQPFATQQYSTEAGSTLALSPEHRGGSGLRTPRAESHLVLLPQTVTWSCLCLKPPCGKLFPGQRQKTDQIPQAYKEYVLFHWNPQHSLSTMFISHSEVTKILAYASEPSEIDVYLCILSKETEEQILWREVKEQPLYTGARKHVTRIKALNFLCLKQFCSDVLPCKHWRTKTS